jgi:hypothetical protein
MGTLREKLQHLMDYNDLKKKGLILYGKAHDTISKDRKLQTKDKYFILVGVGKDVCLDLGIVKHRAYSVFVSSVTYKITQDGKKMRKTEYNKCKRKLEDDKIASLEGWHKGRFFAKESYCGFAGVRVEAIGSTFSKYADINCAPGEGYEKVGFLTEEGTDWLISEILSCPAVVRKHKTIIEESNLLPPLEALLSSLSRP